MKIAWMFFIIAIVCALCDDKIDKALHVDEKVKKVIFVVGIGVILIGIAPMIFRAFQLM